MYAGRHTRQFLGIVSCLLLSGPAPGEAGPPALESVSVTGTRLAVPARELSAHISVIDREMIARLDKGSVTDLLRSVPGLQVSRQGGPGGVTSVYIRGGEANFSVVMVDGIQVNDPTNSRGGSFDFSGMDVGHIERIEVVRGTQSALYGADALSGVINIVTREGAPEPESSLQAGTGSHGYRHLGYRLAGSAQGRWDFALGIGHKDLGHPVSGSSRRFTTATGKAAYRLSGATEIRGNVYFNSARRRSFPEDSGGPVFAVAREQDRGENDTLALRAGLRHRFNQYWVSEVSGSWYRLDDELDSPGIFPFLSVPPNYTAIDFERLNLAWVNILSVNSSLSAGFGIDLEREQGESAGFVQFFGTPLPTDFGLERDTRGYFLELQARFGNGISVNGSVRRDDPDTAGAETTCKAGMRYRIGQTGTVLRMNWGEGFKLPSFFALGHALVGNPGLQPERSKSYDLGLSQAVGRHGASATLNLFLNDFTDLVDFDPNTFTNVNRGSVETKGVEFHFYYPMSPGFDLRAGVTFMDIDAGEAGVKLRGRPRWKVGLQSNWRLRENLSLSIDYQWVDEVFEASRHTGNSVVSALAPYHRLDVSLAWRPQPAWEFRLALDNALDEGYAEAVGFPAPGIQPRISASYRF